MLQTEDPTARFYRQADERHRAEVEAGKHDDECEWGMRERGGRQVYNMICNCSKRQRERDGYVTPPGPLVYNAPSCPRCYADAVHDGDCWTCPPCLAVWPNERDSAKFTDDYGDLTK